MYSIALLFLVGFVVALAVTPGVRDVFLRHGWVDSPDHHRKVHQHPIPRVGGIAIALGFLGAYGVLLVAGLTSGQRIWGQFDLVLRLAPAVAVMFGLGLMDDLWGVKAWGKFWVQLGAGALAWWGGVQVHSINGYTVEGWWWSLPATVFWLTLTTNAFNLIDGVDGLATGVGLFATLTSLAAGLMYGNVGLALATAPLAGALLGFLRYNFNPASIFLGDSGSYFTGFLLGCYGVLWSQKSATLLGMTAPLMALAVPLIDTGVAVARRWMSGKPIFGADRGHVHHMLLKKGWTQRRAVLALYGVSGVCAGLSLLSSAGEEQMAGGAMVVFCGVAWLGLQHLGYAEFGAAGRMFRLGTIRKAVGAQVVLKTGEERLKASVTGQEQYAALEWMCRELAFAGVRLEKDGVAWEGRWQEGACWTVEMEARAGVRVTVWHVFGPNGPASVVAPMAEMVKGVLGGAEVVVVTEAEGDGAAVQEA